MNSSGTRHSLLWKRFALLVLLLAPIFVWAAQGEQKKKEKENPPSSKPQAKQEQTKAQQPKAQQPPSQQPKAQRPQPQYQQPKAQPQYQQPKAQPQYQQPKAQPQYQQPKAQPQYQQPKAQPQYQQPKAQPQYQQPKAQPQYQQPKAQPQYQQPKAQPQYQQPKAQPQYQQPKAQPQFQQPKVQPQSQQKGQQPAKMLTPVESKQQIQTLNQNRQAMKGINRAPLPPGQVAVHADGSRTIAASNGRQFQVRPNGSVASVALNGGRTATFRPNGGFATVRTGGMEINHGLRGERQVMTVRPDHSRVVSVGARRGYVERPYMQRGGRTYVQRTYVINNVTYTRAYRSYYYHGMPYYGYVPPYYYHPAFYGWAYNPWRARVYYRWPWFVARPAWYTYWGPYFAPAAYYPSAAFWVTDFMLAANLQSAYDAGREAQANADAQAQAYQPPPEPYQPSAQNSQITPEMREAIAEEVRQQIAAEQQGAAAPQQAAPEQAAPTGAEATPGALDPAQRLFVVSNNLAVSSVDGQDCELTGGDLITRLDDNPDNSNQVRVSISTSKGNDCRIGSTVMVNVSDLQDMHNQLHDQLDSGLKTLAGNSGQGGLPAAPDTGTSAGEVPLPPPDASADSALQAQQQAANQTETQIQQDVAPGGPNN